jgi:hypothetical protein
LSKANLLVDLLSKISGTEVRWSDTY